MRRNLLHSLLLLLTVGVYCSLATAATVGTVRGRVSDSEGAAIKGARLLFHLDTSGRANPAPTSDTLRITDAMGNFTVQLNPGFYDVCVMAKAFAPECRKILISEGQNLQHDIRLDVDPLIVKHLGDKF